jgi:hypothetical protein
MVQKLIINTLQRRVPDGNSSKRATHATAYLFTAQDEGG